MYSFNILSQYDNIGHMFKIFRPGDWTLDIGAGPDWGWTDLAWGSSWPIRLRLKTCFPRICHGRALE